MKRTFTKLTAALALLVGLAIPLGMWGQTTIYSQAGGGSVTGWTFQNNVSANDIDQTSYWLLDAGNPSDYIQTLAYDLSSYTTASLSLNAATYGSGGSPTAVVQVSFDGGSTFTSLTLSGTQPTDKNYKTLTASISSGLTDNVVIKYSNGATSGRGLRLQQLILTASGGGTPVETSNVALAEVDNVVLTAAYGSTTLTEGNNADIAQGTSVTLAYSSLATGYTLAWVVTKQEGGDNVTADVLNGSTLTVPDYNINISATVSQAQQYTITFDAGSGSGTSSQTYYEGTEITEFPTAAPSSGCADAGYIFDGWSETSVDVGSASYTKLTSYTVNGNAMLYAVYKLTEESEFDNTTGGECRIYADVSGTNHYATGSVDNKKIGSTTSIDDASSYTFEKASGYGAGEWAIKYGSDYITYTDSQTNLGTSSTAYKWTISEGTEGTWRVTSGTSGRALIFRAGSTELFGAYSTNNVNGTEYFDLEIIGSSATYATSPVCNPKVATPELSLGTGIYASTQSVTITCTTEGASIYYTLDGTDPTSSSTLYEEAISISETKTLKAIAILSGYDDSDIAEATYTFVIPFTTMQQVYEDAVANTSEHEVYITFNNWVITGTNGGNANQFFLTDASNAYGCVIYGSGSGFVKGNTLSGTVKCNSQYYTNTSSNYSYAELTSLTTSTSGLTVGTGGEVTPVVTTIDALTSDKTGTVVTLNNLTYNGTVLADADNNVINLSNYNYTASLTPNKTYNITGVFTLAFTLNTTTKRINPRSADDVEEVVSSDPTISVTPTTLATFTYEEGNGPSAAQTITVSGTNLEDNITVALSDGSMSAFEICLTEDGEYGYSLTLPQSEGTVSATTVYVRMMANVPTGTGYAGTINITSTSAQVDINLTGVVTAPTGPQVTWDLSTATYSSASTNLVTWSSDYVTFTNAKGASQQNANAYLNNGSPAHTRFYSGHVLTFTPSTGNAITSIEITAYSNAYANTFKNGTWVNGTATVSGSTVTVTPTNGDNSVSVTLGSAAWAYSVTVYYEASTLTPHNITNDVDMVHGTVVATPASAVVGATVTLKIYPAAGYYLEDEDDIEVYGSSAVALTKVNDGTFTFVMPDEDVTVYAIFSVYSGTYYTRVNSTADLIPGRHYIIATSKEAGDAYVMAAQGSGYREVAETTVVGNIIYQTTNAHEIVLSGDNTNFWTLYDDVTAVSSQGYLYAGSSNKLNRRLDNSADNSGKWAVSINEEGAAVIVSQIEGSSVSNTIKFNGSNSPKRFTCYVPTSTMAPVYLYMKGGETDYEFYSNTTYNSLTIGELDIYTVHSPAVLNVTGTLTNEGEYENFIIEDGGQLIQSSEGVKATVKKSIKGYGAGNEDKRADYYLISSPVTENLTSQQMTAMGLTPYNTYGDVYDLYAWDGIQTGKEWRNWKSSNPRFPLEHYNAYLYANQDDVEITFTGTLDPYDNGGGEVQYNNGGFSAMTLFGNPFTCDVYLSSNMEAMAFYRMNDDGDGFIPATGAIKPMEGFFVQAIESVETQVFTLQRSNSKSRSVNVNLSQGNGLLDRAIIRFDASNTLEKFMLNENNTKLFIQQGDKDYAVVRSAAQGEMPVSFKASKNGTYTISVEPESVELAYLHLIDNMTGADIDLLVEPSYTFEARTSDYASRFRLVFSANEGSNENGSETFAYFNGSEWVISNPSTGSGDNATLQVVDMMGRVLSSETISGNANVNINQAAGIYMLRLVNGENVKVQKVVVR